MCNMDVMLYKWCYRYYIGDILHNKGSICCIGDVLIMAPHLRAAAAPELWPMITVSSSHPISSMKGSHTLSLAVTNTRTHAHAHTLQSLTVYTHSIYTHLKGMRSRLTYLGQAYLSGYRSYPKSKNIQTIRHHLAITIWLSRSTCFPTTGSPDLLYSCPG